MKLIWIALLALTLSSCASYERDPRTPASAQEEARMNVENGFNAESYMMAR